jgi:hypothetical protein
MKGFAEVKKKREGEVLSAIVSSAMERLNKEDINEINYLIPAKLPGQV